MLPAPYQDTLAGVFPTAVLLALDDGSGAGYVVRYLLLEDLQCARQKL